MFSKSLNKGIKHLTNLSKIKNSFLSNNVYSKHTLYFLIHTTI